MVLIQARAAAVAILAVFLVACVVPSPASLPAAQLLPLGDSLPGTIMFGKDGNVWIWTEGRARQLTTGDTWRQAQLSPDGTEVAYVYRGANFSEIFVMSADGTNTRRLTRSQSSLLVENDWTFRPTWSPSGGMLAYISDEMTYNPVLWVMNRDGSARRQVLPVSALQEAADAISWAPDERRLAVAAFGSEQSQILIVDLARGTALPLTDSPRGALDPAWSPDGQTLAYAVRESGRMDLRLRRLDGSSEVEVSRGGYSRAPVWSPDGTRLAFLSNRGGSFELFVVDVVSEGGRLITRDERQLTRDLNLDGASGLSWSR